MRGAVDKNVLADERESMTFEPLCDSLRVGSNLWGLLSDGHRQIRADLVGEVDGLLADVKFFEREGYRDAL